MSTPTISGHTFNLVTTDGHIDVVRYLHENGIGGCTTDAMDYAAMHRHLGVIQFLHENRSEVCTPAAIDRAAGNDHYTVVAFLCEYRSEGFTDAVKRAEQAGYSSITTSLQMVEIEGLRGSGASSGQLTDTKPREKDVVLDRREAKYKSRFWF
uniref:Uncharacterized protein n=1 Tax=Globisporangium ultimum (strain ATCC 200006 / CBS 805.95 / DAOM BR144) TaxID=431595 RepID=K3X1S8_GLOUD